MVINTTNDMAVSFFSSDYKHEIEYFSDRPRAAESA